MTATLAHSTDIKMYLYPNTQMCRYTQYRYQDDRYPGTVEPNVYIEVNCKLTAVVVCDIDTAL